MISAYRISVTRSKYTLAIYGGNSMKERSMLSYRPATLQDSTKVEIILPFFNLVFSNLLFLQKQDFDPTLWEKEATLINLVGSIEF